MNDLPMSPEDLGGLLRTDWDAFALVLLLAATGSYENDEEESGVDGLDMHSSCTQQTKRKARLVPSSTAREWQTAPKLVTPSRIVHFKKKEKKTSSSS